MATACRPGSVGPAEGADEDMKLRLEGLGLVAPLETVGARRIYYALACGGRYAHRDE